MPPRSQLNNDFYDPASTRNKPRDNALSCTKCGCQWMELVEVYQFPEYHSVILGQKPTADAGPFFMFRCPKCQEVFEPAVQAGPRDSQRTGYDRFVEHMQNDLPGTVKGEEV